VKRPWLGDAAAVSPEIAESLGLDRPAVRCAEIAKAALRQGRLRTGDLIVGIDAWPFPTLTNSVIASPPGRWAGWPSWMSAPHEHVAWMWRWRWRRKPRRATRPRSRPVAAGRRDRRQLVAVGRRNARPGDQRHRVVVTDVDEQTTAGSLGFQRRT